MSDDTGEVMPGHFRFVVEGRGEFPMDMIRYDEAVFGGGSLTEPGEDRGRREVVLYTRKRIGPTLARWESFGWKVIENEAPLASPFMRLTEMPQAGKIRFGDLPRRRPTPDIGTWTELVKPIADRFKLGAMDGMQTVYSGEGSAAVGTLLLEMASRMDAEIARQGARQGARLSADEFYARLAQVIKDDPL